MAHFLPLQVDYKEKYYAAGRFPGGFMKREGKASDYEILIARLVDRALRPLFPDDFHLAVFVNIWLISAEKDIQPDALAGLAASAALAASDLPFLGPISEVRVCRIDGQFVINPTFSEMERADLELMVAATEENIMMVPRGNQAPVPRPEGTQRGVRQDRQARLPARRRGRRPAQGRPRVLL